MSSSIDSQLNETLRDALVAYYLNEVVPNAAEFVNAQLDDKIKTADDLYQYKLLDVQVSQAVPTSPVASAIASIQQYINAALMSMEPGYETSVMPGDLIRQWREINSQYAIWAANQQLSYYPELYIDPSLRLTKSKYFQQLESDLNQNKIHIDTTQEAVLSYLASFEEVANLTMINGYIGYIIDERDKKEVNAPDFKNGMYYFIGKSRAENVYYWRSVDMSQRTYKSLTGTDPTRPKFDYPQPGAWSDWHKANLPISASAIERTIRPVFFNNRLFVFWVECVDNNRAQMTVEEGYLPGTPRPPDPGSPETKVQSHPMLRLNMVYKKYDDSWSVPQIVIEAWSQSPSFRLQDLPALVDSIAVEDRDGSADLMFVAMYAGYTPGTEIDGKNDSYGFLKTAHIDKNFNVIPLFPAQGYVPIIEVIPGVKKLHVLQVARMFGLDNKGRLQFTVPAFNVAVKSVETSSPNSDSDHWNFRNGQVNIQSPRAEDQVKYSSDTKKIHFSTEILKKFSDTERTIILQMTNTGVTCKLTLVLPVEGASSGHDRLLKKSKIEVLKDERADWVGPGRAQFHGSRGVSNFLVDSKDAIGFAFSSIVVSGFASLEGMFLSVAARAYFEAELVGSQSSGLLAIYKSDGVTAQDYTQEKLYQSPSTRFQSVILRPLDLNNPAAVWPGERSVSFSGGQHVRNPPDIFSGSISIDIETLLPSNWGLPWPASLRKIPLIHGIKMFDDKQYIGHSLKLTFVELHRVTSLNTPLIAPRINTRATPAEGIAEFIDFAGSDINMNDDGTAPRQPIRMNTLFARELINRANIALENLLSWNTQLLDEPPLYPPLSH